MTRVACTHPGRYGDILWSLPTARAVAETLGEKVGFVLSENYAGLQELIRAQPYIDDCWIQEGWKVLEDAPVGPRIPPTGRTPIEIHLGYQGWPKAPTLAGEIWNLAAEQVPGLRTLELDRPWISVRPDISRPVAVHFSDEHFELKVGMYELIRDSNPHRYQVYYAKGSRWDSEYMGGRVTSFMQMAQGIAGAQVFFGCLSSGWVLANALGKPCVIMEPGEPRWNRLFWLDRPSNHLVIGGDGKPTFDARHVRALIAEVLNTRS